VLAEREVERLLVSQGWTILDRNWRGGGGELDLVVGRDGVVHFVEVKARRTSLDDGLEAVTAKKRRKLVVAANAWIARHAEPRDGYRMSVAAVVRREALWEVEWWWDAFDV
jgi:putative endonuclease